MHKLVHEYDKFLAARRNRQSIKLRKVKTDTGFVDLNELLHPQEIQELFQLPQYGVQVTLDQAYKLWLDSCFEGNMLITLDPVAQTFSSWLKENNYFLILGNTDYTY